MRLLRPGVLTALGFLLGSTVSAQAYEVEGAAFEVTFTSEKRSIMIGEPTYLRFVVTNRSPVTLELAVGGDYRNAIGRPENFKIRATRDDVTVEARHNGPSFGGIITFPKIPPGESHTIRLLLPQWVRLSTPGRYRIGCETKLRIGHTQSKANAGGSLQSKRSVNVETETELEVVPTDPDRMGEIISTLGDELLGENYTKSEDALKQLSWIDDDRVIKYFVEALESSSRIELKQNALRNLSRFNTEIALRAIKREMTSKEYELRASASHALANSKHRDAAELLRTMRNDARFEIRLTVLHALGRSRDPKSTELIQSMTNDENEMVRTEALRYLRERGM